MEFYTVNAQVDGKEMQNIKVFTTVQLANAFGLDKGLLSRNYQRHRDEFKEGEHFFFLKGESLKIFKESLDSDSHLNSNSITNLYLWTELGSKLIAYYSRNEKSKNFLVYGKIE